VDTRRLTFACALAAAAAAPPAARGWGHQKYLREESPLRGHHLIFDVLDRGRVHYCVRDARPVAERFPARSLELQTEKALAVWLAALPESAPRVARVDCAASTLDLLVSLDDLNAEGDASSGTGIYWSDPARDGRAFMIVRVNVGAPRAGGFKETAYADTLSLTRSAESDWPATLADLVRDGGLSVDQAAHRYGRDSEAFHFSTFRSLFHELGHAFGLCDLYEPSASKHCDPEHRSGGESASVMRHSDRFGIHDDDAQGLRSLALRFARETAAR
jgi:hypothetical protein